MYVCYIGKSLFMWLKLCNSGLYPKIQGDLNKRHIIPEQVCDLIISLPQNVSCMVLGQP